MISNFEALLEIAFDAIPEPLVLLNSQGSIVAVTQSFLEVFCTCKKDLLANPLSSFCCLAEDTSSTPPLATDWQGQVLWKLNSREEGESCLLSVRKLSTPNLPFAGSLVSIVPLANSGLAADSGKIFQQKRLESLGVFASSVAHDLNNLLTGVLGHISYLRLALPHNPACQDSMSAIEDGARRAASMTQQILEFARGKEVELGTVNLSLVVSAALNLLRGSLPDNVNIRYRSGKQDILVHGDESQLSQLLINLAINAQEALPEGGNIELSLDKAALTQTKYSDGYEVEPGIYAKLTIKDNGEGIPESVRDRIFEPFFTTKQEKGTGLGLASVLSIVRAHRGVIEVNSMVGEGTAFELYLPLGSQEYTKVSEPVVSEIPKGSERILIVDDEESVRIVLQRSLEHLGYEVVIASNGLEALQSFRESESPFGLVVLDMIMPHMPGEELFFKLKELDGLVAVLIASGYSSEGKTKNVLNNGALGYIQKPFAVEELAQEVRRCIDLGRLQREAYASKSS